MSEVDALHEALGLFRGVVHWKTYWSRWIRPYLHGDVLEVGAGIGANTLLLAQFNAHRTWLCLEPDASLLPRLRAAVQARHEVTVVAGTADAFHAASEFDVILYVDVLEHIEDDKGELERAARLLRKDGHLVVLSPAHQALYSPFDQALGHWRRYNRESLLDAAPETLRLERVAYLDSIGLFLSLSNRLLLRQSAPTAKQLWLWDHAAIPCSRLADPLLRHRFGKTIIGVWSKP